MSEETGQVLRYYRCKYCDETHKVMLDKNLAEGRSKFPFPYVILHNSIQNGTEIKELLTILYIDSNLRVRGVDIQEFDEGNLFSKEQVIAISTPLLEEVKLLRKDLAKKELELKDLKEKVNSMGLFKI